MAEEVPVRKDRRRGGGIRVAAGQAQRRTAGIRHVDQVAAGVLQLRELVELGIRDVGLKARRGGVVAGELINVGRSGRSQKCQELC